MQKLKEIINQLMPMFGFREQRVDFDDDNRRIAIFIEDEIITPKKVAEMTMCFNRLISLIAKKFNEGPVTIDFNNYRKEREKLILELARAGAKKAATTKSDVVLPPMNSYERRLVHAELAMRPDVKTESIGQGSGRQVVVKFLE